MDRLAQEPRRVEWLARGAGEREGAAWSEGEIVRPAPRDLLVRGDLIGADAGERAALGRGREAPRELEDGALRGRAVLRRRLQRGRRGEEVPVAEADAVGRPRVLDLELLNARALASFHQLDLARAVDGRERRGGVGQGELIARVARVAAVEDPLVLEQARGEVEVGLAVLDAVGALRKGPRHLPRGRDADPRALQHPRDDVLDGHLLVDAHVAPVPEELHGVGELDAVKELLTAGGLVADARDDERPRARGRPVDRRRESRRRADGGSRVDRRVDDDRHARQRGGRDPLSHRRRSDGNLPEGAAREREAEVGGHEVPSRDYSA